jgi:hypothetical protein
MALVELLLIACFLAMGVGLWLRVDALQQKVERLQAQLIEHVRYDLGPATADRLTIQPPARPAPVAELPRRSAPALRLVKR